MRRIGYDTESTVISVIFAILAIGLIICLFYLSSTDTVTPETYIDDAIVISKTFEVKGASKYIVQVDYDNESYDLVVSDEIYNQAEPDLEVEVQVTDFINMSTSELSKRYVEFYDFK